MKPACWEACFLYPSPTVEHSNNCLLLLCRLFLEPSGHYTKIDAFEAPWDELYNGLPASLPIIDLSGYKSFRLQLYAVDGTATGGWYDFDVDINSSRIEISYFQTTSIYKRVLMGFNSKHLGFISQAQGTWTTSSLYLIVQAK